MPVILATQEAEIRRIAVQSQPRRIFHKILSRKTLSQKKIGLVEWLKVNALSSSPSTLKKKKKQVWRHNTSSRALA
jgi:preprotein translocase subunit Sec63